MKPEVMVLGATGFLGAHVARAFDRRGFGVHATRRESSRTDHLEDVDATWHRVDLDRGGELVEALMPCDAVVDCAGYYPTDGVDIDRARRRGVGRLRRVLDACRESNIARVVFVSSPATLGIEPGEGEAMTESDFYTPGTVDDAYFESKFSMEAEIYRYVDAGLPVVIAIPTAVFGPADIKPTTGEFIVRLANGKLPFLVDGTFDAVDVRDVADGLVAALQQGRPGRRYILGGTEIDINTFAAKVAEEAGVDLPIHTLPGEWVRGAAEVGERVARKVGYRGPSPLIAMDLIHYARPVDDERARGELHHSNRDLDGTIREAVRWFRNHGYFASSP